jgi:hypothetical protein
VIEGVQDLGPVHGAQREEGEGKDGDENERRDEQRSGWVTTAATLW